MPLAPDTLVVASSRQLSTTVASEAVILGLGDGIYYGLDGAGARIWALVQSPSLLSTVADTLAAEFAVERERALRDVLTLAEDLVHRGLLDVVPSMSA